MTFPSDRLISDYQANARITLTGVCLKTPTKTHFSNDNFTAACVTYYENTTNFMFKINGSNPMAQFMVCLHFSSSIFESMWLKWYISFLVIYISVLDYLYHICSSFFPQ